MIVMYEQTINEVLAKADRIEVYNNGIVQQLENDAFKTCLNNLLNVFENATIMPAFGVSLHEETANALSTGHWVKISFNKQQSINDLPFAALLFRLDDCYGINLIRENNKKFEGRCIYVDFAQQINLENILKIN